LLLLLLLLLVVVVVVVVVVLLAVVHCAPERKGQGLLASLLIEVWIKGGSVTVLVLRLLRMAALPQLI
jgi:hypothetical protein